MTDKMTDLQAKYQKLAAEFAKVRSQVPVLKKAVLDEQAKEEQLQEELKSRDQSIRKYEQEVDSLTFRNHQLSVRVEVLQRELEETNTRSKKNKKNAGAPPSNSYSTNIAANVIGEELQSKISENARLHTQLYEQERKYKDEITRLQDKLEKFEKERDIHQTVLDESVHRYMQQVDKLQDDKIMLERDIHQTVLDESVHRYMQQVDKLQDDKIMLEVKLQKRETEKKEGDDRANLLDDKLRSVESDLTKQLHQANEILRNRLPFVDCSDGDLNSLNTPLYDRQQQLQCKELTGQMSQLIHDLVQGFSNWYTYTEQRVSAYPVNSHKEPLSKCSKKYCEYLLENTSHLRPVDQSFKQFSGTIQEDSVTTLETASGLQQFSVCFTRTSAYVSKLLPYQLLSLDEENAASMCTPSLEARNKELQESYRLLEATMSKLNTCVCALAAHSCTKHHLPHSSQPSLLKFLAKSVTDLSLCFLNLAKHFRAKVSLEHELPTFTEKLKVTNDCITSALLSLVNVTGKMSKFFSSNMGFICIPSEKDQYKDLLTVNHPNVTNYRKKAAGYMASLSRPCPDSVPHSTAVHNRKTLYSSTESRDSLAQQVVSLQEKLAKSEQNREHWMLESKLLQMKYDKECLKKQELQKRLGGEGSSLHLPPGSDPGVGVSTPPPPSSPGSPAAVAPGGPPPLKLLGHLDRSISVEDTEAREKFFKQYYTDQMALLKQQLQQADSKAIHMHAECRALFKRLSIVQCDKDKLQTDVEVSNQNVTQYKEELQTTTRSYEGQLSMMSEHLASMNEKLTTQKDEIDILKYQMQNNAKPHKRSFLGK